MTIGSGATQKGVDVTHSFELHVHAATWHTGRNVVDGDVEQFRAAYCSRRSVRSLSMWRTSTQLWDSDIVSGGTKGCWILLDHRSGLAGHLVKYVSVDVDVVMLT